MQAYPQRKGVAGPNHLSNWLIRGCEVVLAMLVGSPLWAAADIIEPGKYVDFSVNPGSNGRAVHSVDIPIPPGVDGFVPKLSLVYENGTGIDVAGVGWRLAGFSSISRCPKALAHDGVVGGVSYKYTDRLCLDGVRLLDEDSGNDEAYHTSATLVPALDKFVRISHADAAASTHTYKGFKVERPDGTTAYYGDYDGAHADACTRAISDYSGSVIRDFCSEYRLSRLENRRTGDAIQYTYRVEDGVSYPSKIGYGSKGNSYKSEINFVWQGRNDKREWYVGGLTHKRTLRLSSITAYSPWPSATQSDAFVTVLDYAQTTTAIANEPTTGSQLSKVTQCRTQVDTSGTEVAASSRQRICKQPITYKYAEDKYLTGSTTVAAGTTPLYKTAVGSSVTAPAGRDIMGDLGLGGRIFDYNGDGLLDILDGGVKRVNCTGSKCSERAPALWKNEGGNYTQASLGSLGSRRAVQIAHDSSFPNSPAVGSYDVSGLADFDGDGIREIVFAYNYPVPDGSTEEFEGVYRYSQTFNSFAFDDIDIPNSGYLVYGGVHRFVAYVDVNGDGRDDIVSLSSGNGTSKSVYLNQYGTSFEKSDSYSNSVASISGTGMQGGVERPLGVRVIDVNGDGLPDIVNSFSGDSSDSGIYLNDPVQQRFVYNQPYTNSLASSNTVVFLESYVGDERDSVATRFLDLNGDGLVDIVYQRESWTEVLINNGERFVEQVEETDRNADLTPNTLTKGYRSTAYWASTTSPPPSGDPFFSLMNMIGRDYVLPFATAQNMDNWGGVVYADINGDGLPDVVDVIYDGSTSSWGPSFSARLNDGVSFSKQVSFRLQKPCYSATQECTQGDSLSFFDLNGDGRPDVHRAFEDDGYDLLSGTLTDVTQYVELSVNKPVGVLAEIDSVARKIVLDYALNLPGGATTSSNGGSYSRGVGDLRRLDANQDDHWTKETIAADENYRLHWTPDLILKTLTEHTRTFTTTGVENVRKQTFTPYAPAVSERGHGFLGFRGFESVDEVAGFTTYQKTVFRQDYPYVGFPSARQTFVSDSLAQDENFVSDLLVTSPARVAKFPYIKTATKTIYDPLDENHPAMYQVEESTTLDNWGNVSARSRNILEGVFKFVEQEESEFYPQLESDTVWDPALLKLATKTYRSLVSGAPRTPDVMRKVGYIYNGRGQVFKEFVEPTVSGGVVSAGTTPQSYNRTYTRNLSINSFGLPTEISINGGSASTYETLPLDSVVAGKTTITYIANHRDVNQVSEFSDVASGAFLTSQKSQYDLLLGLPTKLTDANGLITTVTYDAWGRRIKEVRPDQTVGEVTIEACAAQAPTGCGYQETETNSGRPTVIRSFDALGRTLRESTLHRWGDEYRNVAYAYEPRGLLKSESRPYMTSASLYAARDYDALGRLKKLTRPDGSIQEMTYWGLFTTSFSAAMPNVTAANSDCNAATKGEKRTEQRDALGNVIRVTDACGVITEYYYDSASNLRRIVGEKGDSRLMEWDNYGHKTLEFSSDSGATRFTYDALGKLTLAVDVAWNGVTSEPRRYFYDDLGRLQTRYEPDLTSTWTWGTATGERGLLKQVGGDNGFARTYAYDAYARLKDVITSKSLDPQAETTDPDFVHSVSYDSAGRVDTVTYPTGVAYKNSYDTAGELYQVRDAVTDGLYWKALARDADGAVTSEEYGNGLKRIRTFKPESGFLDKVLTGKPSGSTVDASIQNDTYAFDSLGNLSVYTPSISGVGLAEVYSHDALNRLKKVTTTTTENTADYDAVGNITARSDIGWYSYEGCGGLHRVCSVSGQVGALFSYDDEGNLLSGNGRIYGTESSPGVVASGWTSYNYPGRIQSGSTSETFIYGPDRERLRRISVDGGQTTTTLYLNPRIDLGGTFQKTYLPDNSKEYTQFLYAEGKPFASVVISSPVVGTLWPIGVEDDQLGFTLPTSDPNQLITQSAQSHNANRFLIKAKHTSPAVTVNASRMATRAESNVIFKTEVTTGTANSANKAYIGYMVENNGVWSLSGGKTYRQHMLRIRGDRAVAVFIDGNTFNATSLTQATKDLGPVSAGTKYVVEIETTALTSTLYIYPAVGGTRATGYRHALAMAWKGPSGTLVKSGRLTVTTGTTPSGEQTPTDDTLVFEQFLETSFESREVRYLHGNHQDSTVAVTNADGNLLERLGYDAWGRRRLVVGADDVTWDDAPWMPALDSPPTAEFGNTQGITLPATNLIVWETGRLKFKQEDQAASTVYAVGQRSYGAESVVFKADVETSSNSGPGGRFFQFSVENTGVASSSTPANRTYRRHMLQLEGNQVKALYIDGQTVSGNTLQNVSVTLGTLEIGAAEYYVVEVETTPLTSVLYFYPQGGSRLTGYRHVVALDWRGPAGTLKRKFKAGINTAPGESPDPVYLSNLKEQEWAIGNTLASQATVRGFTQHEHLDGVDLLHMNGRVYDPVIGRFVSADPVLMYPYNPQDLNRYSYVWNNPLTHTDPSGEALPLAALLYGAGEVLFGWAVRTATPRVVAGTVDLMATAGTGAPVGGVAGGIVAAEALSAKSAAGIVDDVAKSGAAETTRVGRWMSETEFSLMNKTGRVVEGGGGKTYVVNPANPDAFTSAGRGSKIYAEFDVPTSVLKPGSKPEWSVIPGPNVTTRLYGPAPTELAPATCITCVIRKP